MLGADLREDETIVVDFVASVKTLISEIQKDAWCQECGLENTARGLLDFLIQHTIPVPEWIVKKSGIVIEEDGQ